MMDFPQPQIIAVNGVELEVFTAGAGKPIVLCHGWPEHAFSWRHQIQPMSETMARLARKALICLERLLKFENRTATKGWANKEIVFRVLIN